jgi:hypothetical protein
MDHGLLARVLVAVATTEPAGEVLGPVALERLATETGTTAFEMRAVCAYAQSAGLLNMSARGGPWRLTRAGRQFLGRGGSVDHALLAFLPQTIDDLHARGALMRGGAALVGHFRRALLDGRARQHAAELVPAAFRGAVDEPTALNLYAAAIALTARLEAEQPPACMAEQMLTPHLVSNARAKLDGDVTDGLLSPDDAAVASAELRSLSRLIPARGRPRGPVETWFRPFPGAAATAYSAP